MHVEISRSHQVLRDGTERTYERHLLRRSFRDGGKVRKETLANLSILPPEAIAAVRAVLAGKTLIDADAAFEVIRSLPHGHAAAVAAMARKLGFPALLGPPGPHRDLAYALVLSRVLRPASKLSTASWWDDVTLGPDLSVAGASTDDIYAAMDWLTARQDDIEKQLAARHLAEGGIAMFDLSSSWVEGSHCELAAYGYSRDGKRGKPQIEYGLLTDKHGRPVAVRVFAGNTADPKAFPEAVEAVRGNFGLKQMIMVGDRGMITSARIKDLRELEGMA
jgi:Transposase DDE domain